MLKNYRDHDWQPDLRTLRYFVVIAEEKSLTKAASRLNIAQPALTRQIARLERELGTDIFRRMPRGMELTETGEILLEHCYTVFAQLARTYRDVQTHAHAPSGIVVVGLPPTPGEFILPPLFARIARDYPQIALRTVEGFSRELEKGVRGGDIALAVMHDPSEHPDLTVRAMLNETLQLVGPPGTLPRREYTLSEAAALPLILPPRPNVLRILVDRAAHDAGLDLNVIHPVDGIWHLKALVRAGQGHTILTRGGVLTEIEQGTLTARPIVDPVINWRLCVVSRTGHDRKPAIAAVASAICDIVADLVATGAWR